MDPLTSGLNTDDAADIDQFRPAKKMKLEAGSLDATEELKEEMADDDEDWDSIYAVPQDSNNMPSAVEQQVGSAAVLPMTSEPTASGVATKSQDDVELEEQIGDGTLPLAAPGVVQTENQEKRTEDGLPAAMLDDGDELVAGDDPVMEGTNAASTHMNEEITVREDDAHLSVDSDRTLGNEPPQIATSEPAKQNGKVDGGENASSSGDSSSDDSSSDGSSSDGGDDAQQIDDPDLMTAPDSDPEPDDASESSSESDDEDDEKVEPMDASALAAMLMNEDGGEGGQSTGDVQPRTQNERTDLLPTPEVTVTPETRKTALGQVSEHLVDQMALIPSSIAGSDQVLDFGSLLCNEQLQVVGVVQDTIGRVQGPMYVTYCKDEEMRQRLGLLPGAQIYFVNDHSKFVFTRNLPSKGTDASNIHDEEIDEDEQEFSDDEKEAEYKRMNKENKKAGNGKLSRGDFNQEADNWSQQGDRGGRGRGRGGRGGRGDRGRGRGARFAYGAPGTDANSTYIPNRGDQPTDGFSGALNYDDDEPANRIGDLADGDYNKHVRPDNLAELMTQGGGAPVHASRGRGDAFGARGRGDRGRGDRGRGRGGRGDRGDRGRGRGDFQRGGRGGAGSQLNGQKASNNSYPDAHNNAIHVTQQQTYPQPFGNTGWGNQQAASAPQAQAIDPQAILHQLQQQQQQQNQQTYQFQGQQYQYAPQHSYAAPPTPAGGYVNPAFGQSQQQQAPQWTQNYQQWPTPQQSSPAQGQQWPAPAYQQSQAPQAPQAGMYQGAQALRDPQNIAALQNVLLQYQQQGRQQ